MPAGNQQVVEPIGEERRREVREATARYIALAEAELGRRLSPVALCFDLRGGTAGMFRAQEGRVEIRYNPWIFARYWQENLSGTVPHEVAHFIVHETRGRRRPRPHGPEWRAWMDFFGADPAVTFDLDLAGIPRRTQRTHAYRCGCREHRLSTTRHNRSRRGAARYCCRFCAGVLVYCG